MTHGSTDTVSKILVLGLSHWFLKRCSCRFSKTNNSMRLEKVRENEVLFLNFPRLLLGLRQKEKLE